MVRFNNSSFCRENTVSRPSESARTASGCRSQCYFPPFFLSVEKKKLLKRTMMTGSFLKFKLRNRAAGCRLKTLLFLKEEIICPEF